MTIDCPNCHKSYKLPRTYNNHPCVKTNQVVPHQEPNALIPNALAPNALVPNALNHVVGFPAPIQMNILELCDSKTLLALYRADFYKHCNGPSWTEFWRQSYRQLNLPRALSEQVLNSGPRHYLFLINRLCFECGTDQGTRLEHYYRYHICRSCQEQHPDKYKLITKSTAKSTYSLNDGHLNQLPDPLISVNPRFRSAAPMALYLDIDCRQLAYEVYGGPDQLKAHQDKRAASKNKRRDNAAERRNQRHAELSQALAAVGLAIRNDSRLHEGYLNGTLDADWTLADVVKMAVEMHWLYNYTPYRNRLHTAVEDYARNLREEMGWGEAYQLAREEVEPDIRAEILRKHPIPAALPWIHPIPAALLG